MPPVCCEGDQWSRCLTSRPTPAAGQPTEKTAHVVEAGEYPAGIARKHGVKLSDFLAWNNLTPRSVINVGDTLVIYPNGGPDPSGEDTATTTSGQKAASPSASQPGGTDKVTHTVSERDNPSAIAAKYGVRTEDFLAWNRLTSSSVLRVGEQYTLYVPNKSETVKSDPPEGEVAAGRKKVEHVVAEGQNPTTIARRYGVKTSDLFKWNGWERTPVLHVGTKVIVYPNPS